MGEKRTFTIQEIISEILVLVGQDDVYTECGGDFPQCGACCREDCADYHNCVAQQTRVDQTQKIREMLKDF